jgi:hypothetical protein
MAHDSRIYTVPDDVLAAHLDGEAVLLHMVTKAYFRLNDTAAVIFRGLERGIGRERILDELCARFEVERDEADTEVERLLRELADRRLIDVADAAP